MNRCEICDCTDEDDPKAGIKIYDFEVAPDEFVREARCLLCHSTIQENLEDLSIADEDFCFAEK